MTTIDESRKKFRKQLEVKTVAKYVMGEIAFAQLRGSDSGAEEIAREIIRWKEWATSRAETISRLQAELDWFRQLHPEDKYDGTISKG